MKTFTPKTKKIWSEIAEIIKNYDPQYHLDYKNKFLKCINDSEKICINNHHSTENLFFHFIKQKELNVTIDETFIYETTFQYMKKCILGNVPSLNSDIWNKFNTFIKSGNNWYYATMKKELTTFMNHKYSLYIFLGDITIRPESITFIINEIIRKYGIHTYDKLDDNFIRDTIIKYIECFFSEFKTVVPDVDNNIWSFLCFNIPQNKIMLREKSKELYEYYNIIGINENDNLEFTEYLIQNFTSKEDFEFDCKSYGRKLHDLTVKFVNTSVNEELFETKSIDYDVEIKNLETKMLILKNQINFIKNILKLLPNYEINGSVDYLKIDTSFINIDKLKVLNEEYEVCQKELENLKNNKEIDDIIVRIKYIASKDLNLVKNKLKELNECIK